LPVNVPGRVQVTGQRGQPAPPGHGGSLWPGRGCIGGGMIRTRVTPLAAAPATQARLCLTAPPRAPLPLKVRLPIAECEGTLLSL
jgi:hypothetical protein